MSRAFALLTAIGSAATFAGVWVATAPAPVVAGPDSLAPSVSAAPMRRLVVPTVRPEPDTHVVRDAVGSDRPRPRPGARSPVYFAGCNEARAAGAAPIYRGDPGYRADMDGDGDGIACEPHR